MVLWPYDYFVFPLDFLYLYRSWVFKTEILDCFCLFYFDSVLCFDVKKGEKASEIYDCFYIRAGKSRIGGAFDEKR